MRTAPHLSSPLFKLSLIALMIAAPTLRDSTEALAQTLVIETADGSANVVGLYTSLALDASGNPHVSYYDNTTFDLKYARKSGGVWTIETADGSANVVGEYASLALDAQENPHVTYYDNTTDDLKYARKSGGGWTIETADGSANVVGEYTSLALDALGNPHVSYYDNTTDDLKYARKSGGVWTSETADGSANVVGQYTSLALDASGNPHVSYLDLTPQDLKYARKSGGVWTIETVDAANFVGYYSSIALDDQGNPHVSYRDATATDLKFASKSGGVWSRETVEASNNNTGNYTSLDLDASGNPQVTYWDSSIGNLRFARKAGGLWTIETLDGPVGVSGGYTSLFLDSQGNPHVSYHDGTNGNLKYTFIPSVVVTTPALGATWAVGATEEISWSVSGGLPTDNADVFLSVDGGRTFELIRDEARDFSVAIRVPHAPTRFAQIKVVRSTPFSVGYSDSFFQIDATIALLKFDATRSAGGDGTRLTWETRPGPEADIRYRVERANNDGSAFSAIHTDLLDRGELVDPAPAATSRYRLIAINGLGEEYVLGETSVTGALALGRDLSIQPNPARGGSTTFVFRAPLDPVVGDAAAAGVEVAMFDLSGRKVATITDGQRSSGVHVTTWDGRDDAGREVAAGVYFARLSWNGTLRATERVTVVR